MFWEKIKKIKKSGKEIEPHEIFLDKLAQRKEAEFGVSEKKFEVPLSQRKLRVLYLVFLILVIFILGKTIHFQVIKGEEFSNLAEKNKQGLYLVQPTSRGLNCMVRIDSNYSRTLVKRTPSTTICHEPLTS